MFPLFPFVVGVLTGAVAVKLLRSEHTRQELEKAQSSLRDATLSGLEAIEQASARARARLGEGGAEPGAPANEPIPPEEPGAAPGAPESAERHEPLNPPLDYVKDDKDETP